MTCRSSAGSAAGSGARSDWPAALAGVARTVPAGRLPLEEAGRTPSMRIRKPACSISRPERPRSATKSIKSRISLKESMIRLEQLLFKRQGGLRELEPPAPEVALPREEEQQIILFRDAREDCARIRRHQRELL